MRWQSFEAPQTENSFPHSVDRMTDFSRILKEAEAAYQYAVAPSSGFRVGAALQSRDGRVFTGCNIESPVYLGICAERVALFKALSEGSREFEVLAIVCEEGVACPPCGTCRQLLWEFSTGLLVVVRDQNGAPLSYPIEDLLPMVFERGGRQPHRASK